MRIAGVARRHTDPSAARLRQMDDRRSDDQLSTASGDREALAQFYLPDLEVLKPRRDGVTEGGDVFIVLGVEGPRVRIWRACRGTHRARPEQTWESANAVDSRPVPPAR